MKTNREILFESKILLTAGKWFWRIVLAYFAFNLIALLLGQIPGLFFDGNLGTKTLENIQTREELVSLLKNGSFLRNFLIICSFSAFISFIARGVANLGMSKILLKAAAHHEGTNWMNGAFEGLRDPFGVFSLFFISLVRVWWIPLFVILPCVVLFLDSATGGSEPNYIFLATLPLVAFSIKPFYRFRVIWFVKAQNPELGALATMKESDRLMNGNKMKSFRLDCSYWKIFTLLALLAGIMSFSYLLGAYAQKNAFFSLLDLALMGLVFYLALFFNVYWDLGHAIFYREILSGGKAPNDSSAQEQSAEI